MPATMITKRSGEGTGAFGLFVNFVVYNAEGGELIREERYFLADKILCKYVRLYGNARAAWRAFPLPTHDDARKLLMRNIQKYATNLAGERVEMVNMPLVVELTGTDLAAMEKHQPPYARFTATDATVKAVGKIDDATWKPVV
jgi:hypothetical protein